MSQQNNRRDFLKTSAAAGVGFWIAGASTGEARPPGPNDRLNVAFVGCGGRGGGNIGGVMGARQANQPIANCVAMCDPDRARAAGGFNRYRDATKFADYRRMLDRMANQIDAVVVSTPDHTHAHASIAAMLLGKHVYCEKPLTHSVWEARQMKEVATRQRVQTQMGNQGTSGNNFRRGVEILRAASLGPVREVHVWTNRPIWPQSNIWNQTTPPAALAGEDVPATLNWDVWQGPAPARAYNRRYLPFAWRGWWDYGTGAIGDMACHTMNLAFMGLNLEAPTAVSATIDNRTHNTNDQTPPYGCVVTYEFPAIGNQPAFQLKWYERHRPEAALFQGQRPSNSGALIVCQNGTMYQSDDYGNRQTLLPIERYRNFRAPEPTLPRVSGQHHREWIDACRGGRAALSNFPDYASKLTETALLGNVAIRCGRRFTWDSRNLRANLEAANNYVRREYRRGWELRTRPQRG